MKNRINTKKIIKTIIFYLIVITTLVLSWRLSSQSGTESGIYTKKMAKDLAYVLYRYGEIDINNIISMNGWIHALNEIIRKVIHFFEYSFIGMLLCVTLNLTFRKEWLAAFLSLLVCTGWAYLDECHQSFVAGRFFRYFDIGIDITGAFLAIIITTCFVYFVYRIKKLKQQITEFEKQKD